MKEETKTANIIEVLLAPILPAMRGTGASLRRRVAAFPRSTRSRLARR